MSTAVPENSENGPEEAAISCDLSNRVRSAVLSLPEPQRLCLVLQYYHGFSLEKVARVARCPLGTAKSRIHAALGKLRLLLSEVDGQ